MLILPDDNNAPPNSSPGGDGYASITNSAGLAGHESTGRATITGAFGRGTDLCGGVERAAFPTRVELVFDQFTTSAAHPHNVNKIATKPAKPDALSLISTVNYAAEPYSHSLKMVSRKNLFAGIPSTLGPPSAAAP